jgi:hypothetical protein
LHTNCTPRWQKVEKTVDSTLPYKQEAACSNQAPPIAESRTYSAGKSSNTEIRPHSEPIFLLVLRTHCTPEPGAEAWALTVEPSLSCQCFRNHETGQFEACCREHEEAYIEGLERHAEIARLKAEFERPKKSSLPSPDSPPFDSPELG